MMSASTKQTGWVTSLFFLFNGIAHVQGLYSSTVFSRSRLLHKQATEYSKVFKSSDSDSAEEPPSLTDRRQILNLLLSGTLSTSAGISAFEPSSADAYDQTYPLQLDYLDAPSADQIRRRAMAEKAPKKPALSTKPSELGIGSLVWGTALWLLSGSRSNPIATPLANLIYDTDKEDWLKDRNEGLFAALPLPFLVLLLFIFLGFGFLTDLLVITLADGSGVSIQLAGVLLIGSISLELGRIASGEKKQDRQEYERDTGLEEEFDEFAEQRLILGSTAKCHRSEVVRAFRRFYGKYRQADTPNYELTDIEIEQLLRRWNKKQMRPAERSATGFYAGLRINDQADVFV